MSNPFSGIVSPELKQLFNNAIDSLLENNALTLPCKLRYAGQQNPILCNNCIYDPITKLSANLYNGTGPNPFADGTICPVCVGNGITDSEVTITSKIFNLAVIFDSKYFLNTNKLINIPQGNIQTLCSIHLMPHIRSANDMIVDTKIQNYADYIYERESDPEPAGLGDSRYIITMWRKK